MKGIATGLVLCLGAAGCQKPASRQDAGVASVPTPVVSVSQAKPVPAPPETAGVALYEDEILEAFRAMPKRPTTLTPR